MNKLIEELLNKITIEDVSNESVETYVKMTVLIAELQAIKLILSSKMTNEEKDEALRILKEGGVN